LIIALSLVFFVSTARGADFFISPGGNDKATGTKAAPFATLQRARDAVRAAHKPVSVYLGDGTYYLPETLILTDADSGVTWRAVNEGKAVVSGGINLQLQWQPYKDGIMQAQAPADLKTEEFFVNGQRQILARYPNYDPKAQYFDGYAADAISKERAARWANPAGGYFHAMHPFLWGDFTWVITGKDANGEVTKEGGWQNNRGGAVHEKIRFVENILEELDTPGEWFLDRKTHVLYFYPPAGLDLTKAVFEATRLNTLVEFRGSEAKPVRSVVMKGLSFRQANRTVMQTKEPILRSDWAIYRGGAILFNGAEDCTLEDALLDQVGGNAVFVNNYNRRLTIRGCEIVKAGASGVLFFGDPAAVRSPLFNYDERQSPDVIDRTPGPKTNNYPADCLVEDCLIHLTGRVEKQSTGVAIDMAQNITVRHCSIYDMPRAGINIGDGCWGGHVIEFCDIFDTVKETGDHGSYNSWGRDRYWLPSIQEVNALVAKNAELPMLDCVKPTILRNTRWRCDHGWDIDLDDGSSNYEIYNNLCLVGGLKLREGFNRKVTNNILLNNSLHPHCWYEKSGDVVKNNIVMREYRPAGGMPGGQWGKEINWNFFASNEADRTRFASNGCDVHSIVGDPMFRDPAKGDFRVKDGAPALKVGFKNFPMDQFGVTKPSLKARARTAEIPSVSSANRESAAPAQSAIAPSAAYWLGATLHALTGEEFSAFGVSRDEGGVQLKEVPAGSAAARAGLKTNDLIQGLNKRKVSSLAELFAAVNEVGDGAVLVRYTRSQKAGTLTLQHAPFVVTESAADAVGFTKLMPRASASGVVSTNHPTANEPLPTLVDGVLAKNYGPVFTNEIADGAYKMDLGASKPVAAITSWSFNQDGKRARQIVTLFGSNAAEDPGWNTGDAARFTPLGTLDTASVSGGDFVAASLRTRPGQSLGTFRWIVWKVAPVTPIGENTAYQELAVVVAP
jgi:hypothetical protein